MNDQQRQIQAARAIVRSQILQRIQFNSMTVYPAIQALLADASANRVAATVLIALQQCRASSRPGLPGARSLLRWFDAEIAPAPKPTRTPSQAKPAWADALLAEYRRPQKPFLSEALRALAREGVHISYSKAQRYLASLGNIERQRGRLLERDLRNLKPFVRRDFSDLLPLDVVVPDGHSFDAEITHPFNGRPFRPEITTYIDVATRRIVGWSVWLAESSAAILAAFAAMVRTHGVPAVHYSDRGAYRSEFFTDSRLGIFARVGCQHTFSLPYNSQARGVIERLHSSVWTPLAREYPTYMGEPMDAQARKTAYTLTRRDNKLLPDFSQFLGRCAEAVARYNAKPTPPYAPLPTPCGRSLWRRAGSRCAWQTMI